MGSICSKGTPEEPLNLDNKKVLEKSVTSLVQLVSPVPPKIEEDVLVQKDGSMRYVNSKTNGGGDVVVGRLDDGSKKRVTVDVRPNGLDRNRIMSMPCGAEAELVATGWPQWLTSAAGEAIRGWLPRRIDSFEKLEKIGQGTYSSVYRAKDLETKKIVAMKKVRFLNMDPESVRFMAREIRVLRRLDHPNVMKLEAIVTSRISESLYLVFEYMEHDLSGLAATPSIKFTEPQIKCYMQQLFRGLEHCHTRGVLHRDIKGSNLLINDDGVLKIGDFGLATFYQPDQDQALTSRVVTLWYRAPELLLGSSEYGAAIDLWSAGCMLAEMFAGKPIMPGRTEVEQMHKILKLCGSPSEDYWEKTKLPHSTSFKSQQGYKRCLAETFKEFPPSALALVDRLLSLEPDARGSATSALRSEFFRSEPLPCEPSSLPKYPPSKELDAKLREEESRRRRQREDAAKGNVTESVRKASRDLYTVPTPEFIAKGHTKTISNGYKYAFPEGTGSAFQNDPPRGTKHNGFTHSASMIHTSAGLSFNNNVVGSARHKADLMKNRSHLSQGAADVFNSSLKKDDQTTAKQSSTGNVFRKSRIQYSGPLMPPGGNMDDILKEHERQIQQAVRNARLEKSCPKANLNGYGKHQGRHKG